MKLYPQVVVIHNLATLVLILGLLLLAIALLNLRGAVSLKRIRSWTRLALIGEKTLTLGAVTLLLSGLYLLWAVWKFQHAWVNLSLLALLPLTLTVVLWLAPRLEVIKQTAQNEATISRAVSRAIHDPALWTSVALVLAGSLGIWVLMVWKPSGLVAIVAILLALLLGLGLAMLFERKEEL